MRNEWVLGIDTSNYTTSLCVLDELGHILFEARRVLEVPLGDHGLMQSQALFQHVQNLPTMLDDLRKVIQDNKICRVGVSAKPRPREDSYMPVFLPGVLCAHAVAAAAGADIIETSHQAGHIAAGLMTADRTNGSEDSSFFVLHLSGGTTDLLLCTRAPTGYDFSVLPLASSLDLHAGQFVDRIGVMLGLPFPAGPHLEKLAEQCVQQDIPAIATAIRSGSPSFAGPFSAAKRLYEAGNRKEVIAAAALRAVATTIEKMIRYAWEQSKPSYTLLVGGVASNQLIRTRLEHRLGRESTHLAFCHPQYASDNALGVAKIASDSLRLSKK